ncbi:hypothetical protein AC249_AIPGENE2321 [Exaiptasia diaphana]|nr:hypothetical protein AC249_AIPGENE2321 [Exaiptasia diaphana]
MSLAMADFLTAAFPLTYQLATVINNDIIRNALNTWTQILVRAQNRRIMDYDSSEGARGNSIFRNRTQQAQNRRVSLVHSSDMAATAFFYTSQGILGHMVAHQE